MVSRLTRKRHAAVSEESNPSSLHGATKVSFSPSCLLVMENITMTPLTKGHPSPLHKPPAIDENNLAQFSHIVNGTVVPETELEVE